MKHLDIECENLYAMYTQYGFPINEEHGLLETQFMMERIGHLEEELTELIKAVRNHDIHEVADALVDLVVLAKGTAVMMGLPWHDLWREVHRANSAKEVGVNKKRPGYQYDLVKPPGWVPPRIAEILDGSP
jgi:predicted HAD superfamily Cof-like phosphohydrolase